MKTFNQTLLVFLLGVFLLVGCSKNDDDDNDQPEVAQLKIQEKLDEIEVPQNLANSQSSYAFEVNLYVAQIKAIAGYFSFFDPVDNAEYDDGTYFWTSGAQSIWMEYSESSDAYIFEMDVDFGSGNGRVDYITSQEKKDGSSGWIRIFDFTDDDNDEYVFEYSWVINSDGSIKVTYFDSDEDDKIEMLGHPNDSGYVKFYDDGDLEYEFVWNSDGSGFYKEYDDDGEEIDSQSWTVADL